MSNHWKCPDCGCGNYNVLNNKSNEIGCKKCPWNNKDLPITSTRNCD